MRIVSALSLWLVACTGGKEDAKDSGDDTGTTEADDTWTYSYCGTDTGAWDTGDTHDTGADSDTGDGDTGSDTADTGDTAPDTGDTGPDLNPDPTPDECGGPFAADDPAAFTPPAGIGPYWRADAPERAALNARQDAGTRLILSLRVIDLDGAPQPGRRVTVWAAGMDGLYDTAGADANAYGWQRADADGRVCFALLRPPNYTDGAGGYNPAHVHLAISDDPALGHDPALESSQELGTQFYFVNDPWLTALQPPELIVSPEAIPTGERVRYDIVLGALPPP